MAALTIAPMTEHDLDEAAVLLARRHADHCSHQPLLDPAYANPDTARAAMAWDDDTSGAVARLGGELVGYLFGAPKPMGTWGPNVWVESAGIAVRDAETARDLYAAAAEEWVAQGHTAHYALVPAHDAELVDAWFRLGFGLQHQHAVRTPMPAPTPPPGVTIRAPMRADVPALIEIEMVLPAHQGASPVFSPGPPYTREDAAAEWEESFDDPRFTSFVAERDGVVLGSATGSSITVSSQHVGPARPDRAGFLGFAAVLPAGRGAGLGRALGAAVLGWADDEGYRSVVTDWRATNLLSSRTWPRLGFVPTFSRLHRVVGY